MRLLPRFLDNPETRSLWRVNKIYWLCILAIFGWLGLRQWGLHAPLMAAPEPVDSVGFSIVVLLAAANLALRSASAVRRSRGSRLDTRISWLFTIVDMFLIAAGLRLSGGIHSELWVVLFLLVMAETILSPHGEARLVIGGAWLALIAGTWSPALPPGPYLFDIAVRLFFLTIVSVITRRLRENATEREHEVANLRAELAAVGERAKISRDIHDSIGNALAAAVLRLEVAARVTQKQPEAVGDTLRDEATALRETMNAVRDWTFLNRPWSAGDDVLPPSEVLTRETNRLSQRMSLPVAVEGAEALDGLSEPLRVAALRIIQEALTNAAKYGGGAARADVSLRREGRTLRLTIADDGKGFDTKGTLTGMGLTSMRERAESLGGRLTVDSTPGLGTTITALLPTG